MHQIFTKWIWLAGNLSSGSGVDLHMMYFMTGLETIVHSEGLLDDLFKFHVINYIHEL